MLLVDFAAVGTLTVAGLMMGAFVSSADAADLLLPTPALVGGGVVFCEDDDDSAATPSSSSSSSIFARLVTNNACLEPAVRYTREALRSLALLWSDTLRLAALALLFLPLALSAPLALSERLDYPCRPRWMALLVNTLEAAGPAFIKWGQWAATRHDLFPPDACAALERLHASAPAHPYKHTRAAILRAFGTEPEDLFDFLDPRPLASGSIGQVHRASLSPKAARAAGVSPGLIVAVKVRHPGVGEAIARDFAAMAAVARWVSAWVPGAAALRLEETLEQFSAPLREQVDLSREAENLFRFCANFRRARGVSFPQPLYPLVAEDVLVESYEAGTHIGAFLPPHGSSGGAGGGGGGGGKKKGDKKDAHDADDDEEERRRRKEAQRWPPRPEPPGNRPPGPLRRAANALHPGPGPVAATAPEEAAIDVWHPPPRPGPPASAVRRKLRRVGARRQGSDNDHDDDDGLSPSERADAERRRRQHQRRQQRQREVLAAAQAVAASAAALAAAQPPPPPRVLRGRGYPFSGDVMAAAAEAAGAGGGGFAGLDDSGAFAFGLMDDDEEDDDDDDDGGMMGHAPRSRRPPASPRRHHPRPPSPAAPPPPPPPQLPTGALHGSPYGGRLAELGSGAMLQMMLLDNLVHSDLHPGNILVRLEPPDGWLLGGAYRAAGAAIEALERVAAAPEAAAASAAGSGGGDLTTAAAAAAAERRREQQQEAAAAAASEEGGPSAAWQLLTGLSSWWSGGSSENSPPPAATPPPAPPLPPLARAARKLSHRLAAARASWLQPRIVLLDVGMATELSSRDQDCMLGLFRAFAAMDGRAAARWILKFPEGSEDGDGGGAGRSQACADPQAFEEDMEATFAQIRRGLAEAERADEARAAAAAAKAAGEGGGGADFWSGFGAGRFVPPQHRPKPPPPSSSPSAGAGEASAAGASDDETFDSGAAALAAVLEHIRRHGVSLPGHICAVVVTTLVLQSWSNQLDPQYSVLEQVRGMFTSGASKWRERVGRSVDAVMLGSGCGRAGGVVDGDEAAAVAF
jgi:predicted unusual protein kinase regulating ubiquinone biosynthesis (AarF/ABC1/UbiB family)